MPMYFEQAYACAVFPRVTRAGFVFGGAYGRGIVIAADQLRGTVTLTSLTLGFQVGGQADSQIIFFRDAEALELFIATGNLGKLSGRVEFQGRASAVAVAAGGATTPGFSGDVAVFSLTPRGLMLELAAGLVRYRFSPADENLADGQTGEGGD